MANFNWTKKEEYLIRKMWNSRTAQYIADKLGRSRSMVLGKGLRMGLSNPKTNKSK